MSRTVELAVEGVDRTFDGVTVITTRDLHDDAGHLWRDRWVEESRATTGVLRVTKAGTYRASDFGWAGFERVEVLVDGGEPAYVDMGDGRRWQRAGIAREDAVTIVTEGGVRYAVAPIEGVIHKVPIPSEVRFGTKPVTTGYHVGDSMDYGVASLVLMDSAGRLMTDAWPTLPRGAIHKGTAAWRDWVVEDSSEFGTAGVVDVTTTLKPFWVAQFPSDPTGGNWDGLEVQVHVDVVVEA